MLIDSRQATVAYFRLRNPSPGRQYLPSHARNPYATFETPVRCYEGVTEAWEDCSCNGVCIAAISAYDRRLQAVWACSFW